MRRTVFLLAALSSLTALAASQSPQDKIAQFRQMLAENQQKRKMFTWLETTQVAYQGTIKMTKVSDCQFMGPAPKPICTELSLQQAALPGGFIRRRVAEEKQAELKAYMDSVRALVATYVPLQPPLIDKAYQSGNVAFSPDPETGVSRIVISNYQQPGDRITITYSPATRQIKRVQLATWLNTPSAVVTADVTFATLPNGVFYAYQKVLNAEAKQVTVTVTSTDFAEMIEQ